jgi:hypothetical protein
MGLSKMFRSKSNTEEEVAWGKAMEPTAKQ